MSFDTGKVSDRYIVTGGGRTGSHWVEQIIKFIQPQWEVVHTNDLDWFDQSVTDPVVVVWRRDLFAAIVSFFVARHTDEWFTYTKNIVQPFVVDVDEFKQKVMDTHGWNHRFNTEIRPRCFRVVDVWYESMISYSSPEEYMAFRLGLNTVAPKKTWDLNKNSRDYTILVKNHADLQKIFLEINDLAGSKNG